MLRVGIIITRDSVKTKLELWNLGKNFGRESYYWCGEKESGENALECKK